MAERVDFLAEYDLVLITLQGRVDGPDLPRLLNAVLDSQDWKPGFNTFWDARGITKLVVEPEHLSAVQQLSAHRKQRRGRGKTAVVAMPDIDLMIAELLQHTIKFNTDFRTFTSLRDAAQWMEVDVAVLEERRRKTSKH